MTRDQIASKLATIFHEVFDDETIVIRPDLSANDVDAWDSLTHIRMLTVEREFKVSFSVTEIGDLKNVGELTDLILKKTSGA